MTKSAIYDSLIMLLRSEMLCSNIICDYTPLAQLSTEQWSELMELSKRHGVKYLLFEAISKLPEELHPSSELMLHWYVDTQKSEERYLRYVDSLEELAAFISQNGLSMILLKGFTIATLYPVPQRREGGDIDIFILDGYTKGEDLVREYGGSIRCASRRSKHSQFGFKGINVDNHKLFVMDSEGLTPKLELFYSRIEGIIQVSVASGDLDSIKVGEQTLYTLQPNVAALYFITHTFRHVVVEAVSMRHILDWMALFNHHREVLDRELLLSQIEECELGCFVANVEAFCQERFSFTPFFDFKDRYTIERGALSIESTLFKFKSRAQERSLFGKIKSSLTKILSAQRYYALYLGIASYRDYLIPNLVSRAKELCHTRYTTK